MKQRPVEMQKMLVINKMFLFGLLLIQLEIVIFMVVWSAHRLDYVKTGCAQFQKAGLDNIAKSSPLYSKSLDIDKDGIDCN